LEARTLAKTLFWPGMLLGGLGLIWMARRREGGGGGRWTVDGGGGTLSNEAYTLSGTVGQADAATLSNGGYTLTGGFWPGSSPVERKLYLPVVLRAP